MSYYCYNEPDGDDNRTVTMSEQEIRDQYWDYWYDNICRKYGKEYADANFSFEECLDDWCIVHGAWKV